MVCFLIERRLLRQLIFFHSVQSGLIHHKAEQFSSNYARALLCCDMKEIVTESFAVTYKTAVTSVVLFRSESKGSGFQANEYR